MAAGQGFKTFTTGEVLTASDVNGYLMQGVLVFASAAARDAAITSPQEGQYAYLKDTNVTYYYDGSTWVVSGATGDITSVTAGTGISGGGASGDVTITNSMATAITTAGDLIQGTGSGTFARLGIGTNGQVLSSNGTSATWSTPSTGTITFTHRFTASSSWSCNALATNGSTIMVAVGSTGILYSSTDSGSTWTSRTSGFGTNSIWHVAFGNGLFVAVGANGTITTSTDGITWTARTSGVSTNQLNCVVYSNSLWVAVGAGANGGTGGITTSTDGITWTKRTTPTTSASSLNSVAYGGGYWVAVGDVNTKNGYYSTDAATWTVLGAGMIVSLDYVYYNGTNWFALDVGTTSRYIVGAPTGTWSNISGPPQPRQMNATANNCVAIYNSNLYFIPQSYNGIPTMNRASTAMTSQYMTSEAPPVFTPDSANQGLARSLFIDSAGKLFLADANSRLYTAQL